VRIASLARSRSTGTLCSYQFGTNLCTPCQTQPVTQGAQMSGAAPPAPRGAASAARTLVVSANHSACMPSLAWRIRNTHASSRRHQCRGGQTCLDSLLTSYSGTSSRTMPRVARIGFCGASSCSVQRLSWRCLLRRPSDRHNRCGTSTGRWWRKTPTRGCCSSSTPRQSTSGCKSRYIIGPNSSLLQPAKMGSQLAARSSVGTCMSRATNLILQRALKCAAGSCLSPVPWTLRR